MNLTLSMLPRFNADVQSIILFQGRQPAITEAVAAFMVLAVGGICALTKNTIVDIKVCCEEGWNHYQSSS